eukprot:gene4040-737_t
MDAELQFKFSQSFAHNAELLLRFLAPNTAAHDRKPREVPCGACSAPNPGTAKFCNQCGHRIAEGTPGASSTSRVGGVVSSRIGGSGLTRAPVSAKGAKIRADMDALEDEVFLDSAYRNFGDLSLDGNYTEAQAAGRQGNIFYRSEPAGPSALAPGWHSGPSDPEGLVVDCSDRNLLCMSVKGAEVCVGGADHGLKVFGLDNGRVKRTLYTKKFGHTEWVTACCHLSDSRIVSGGMDNKICLWSAGGAVRCEDLVGHKAPVSQIVSNDKNIFISASYDRSLIVWNADRKGLLTTMMGHKKPVLELIWFSEVVASGDRDGAVHVWDASQGSGVAVLPGHAGHVTALTHLCDGTDNMVVSGGQDGCVLVWDLRASQAPVHKSATHPGGAVSFLRSTGHSSGRSMLISAGADSRMVVLDPAAGFAPLHTLSDHKDFIYSVEVVGDK